MSNDASSWYNKFVNIINSGQKLFTMNQNLEKLIQTEKEVLYALAVQNNREYYEKICSLLQIRRPAGIPLKRFGRAFDGGYIMADCFSERTVAYSFGICDDVSWDRDLAERGIPVFMYDHTIAGLPESHPNFHFFPTGIGTKRTKSIQTLSDILEQNGHARHGDLVLKLDVEGVEYDVVHACDERILNNFSQIVIEWHHILEPSNNAVLPVLEKINALFQCIHIHGQRVPCARLGHKILPNFIEATYLRKKDFSFTDESYTGPLDIDYPTFENSSEIYLGDYST